MPILVIESYEEPRVLEMLTGLAVTRTLPLLVWSITEGLNRLGFGEKPEEGDQLDECGVLEAIKEESTPPDKKAPKGTSAIDCMRIDSFKED